MRIVDPNAYLLRVDERLQHFLLSCFDSLRDKLPFVLASLLFGARLPTQLLPVIVLHQFKVVGVVAPGLFAASLLRVDVQSAPVVRPPHCLVTSNARDALAPRRLLQLLNLAQHIKSTVIDLNFL